MSARRFFLIAGEPSGDRLGGALMEGLRQEAEGVEFQGVGGPLMAAQGLDSLFPMEELSIMGLAEVLPKLRGLLARVDQTAKAVLASGAGALITIDSPDFCLRVAKKVKAARPDFPVIHYVAPSVWAWRPKRAVKMARVVDHVLTLLPFEPPLMQAAGMSADFVGHPVVTEPQADAAAMAAFRAELGFTPADKILTALPGSRAGEVARVGPVFRDVVRLLQQAEPDLKVVVPTVEKRVGDLHSLFQGMDVTILDPRGRPPAVAEQRKRACFATSMAALAASGTVSLELSAADTPMVIAYRMQPLTAYITERLVKIDTATLVNIVTGTRAVPEFWQKDCRADLIYPAIHHLLSDATAGAEQHDAMRATMQALGAGGVAPGVRAARSVLAFLT